MYLHGSLPITPTSKQINMQRQSTPSVILLTPVQLFTGSAMNMPLEVYPCFAFESTVYPRMYSRSNSECTLSIHIKMYLSRVWR